MPKLDLPPDGPALTWHTMRDWLYKLWLNMKGMTFGADDSTYSSAILSTAGQSDLGKQVLMGASVMLFAGETQTAQSIPTATYTTLTNWSATIDSVGGFNPTTGVYTAQSPGIYLATGTCSFGSAGWWTSSIAVGSSITVNGAQKVTPFNRTVTVSGSPAVGIQTPQAVWLGVLLKNDTVSFQVFQNSGVSQSTEGGHTTFGLVKLAEILQQ